ncbi:YcjX family protein [Teichococcus aerophilus]|nr:YcjX family protein [Pseudoroseomonas aerophila]
MASGLFRIGEDLGGGMLRLVSGITDEAERLLNETTLRVAITGLSRSGKTVFITSLIANLMAMGRGRQTLPALTAQLAANGTALRSVQLEPAGTQSLDWFDAADKLRDLAGTTPHWPPRTSDLASASLTLSLERSGPARILGARRVRLELLDYPGEWLLDLPLLDQDFAQWSAETIALLSTPPRLEVAKDFLDFIATLDAAAPADEAVARRGHRLYLTLLEQARDRFGLRWLQPGRFLRPGPRGESPMMWFFPLPGAGSAPSGSLRDLLARRFAAYRDDMRQNFFDPWFARFDRQVVLVDVLGALWAGQGAFEDSRHAVAQIAAAYDARSRSRWFGLSTLKRVGFVASKADHVPAAQRPALEALFASMMATPGEDRRTTTHRAIAALRCTEDATHDGLPVVLGVPLGEGRRRPFRPGHIPTTAPPAGDPFWSRPFFELPALRPPLIDPDGRDGLPNLGLDALLSWLLEDAL